MVFVIVSWYPADFQTTSHIRSVFFSLLLSLTSNSQQFVFNENSQRWKPIRASSVPFRRRKSFHRNHIQNDANDFWRQTCFFFLLTQTCITWNHMFRCAHGIVPYATLCFTVKFNSCKNFGGKEDLFVYRVYADSSSKN